MPIQKRRSRRVINSEHEHKDSDDFMLFLTPLVWASCGHFALSSLLFLSLSEKQLFCCSFVRSFVFAPKKPAEVKSGERCENHPGRQTWVVVSYRIPRDLRTRTINGWGGKCLLGISFQWFSSLMFSLHFYQANINDGDEDEYNNWKLVTTTSQYTFMRVKWGRSNYRTIDISLESEASCSLCHSRFLWRRFLINHLPYFPGFMGSVVPKGAYIDDSISRQLLSLSLCFVQSSEKN